MVNGSGKSRLYINQLLKNDFYGYRVNSDELAKELGYTQLLVDANGNGKWCFEPKSIRSDCRAFTR